MLEEWMPFAETALNTRRVFHVMHGEDRIGFRQVRDAEGRLEVVTTVSADPAARAKIDALSEGDGTYSLFDRIFDGYELFVPWSSKYAIRSITTPSRSWHAETLDFLMSHARSAKVERWSTPPVYSTDPDLLKLADDLFAAATAAKKLKMLISISY
ncbi:hypothetical protein DPM19_30955 [Actinomadura craniellae]|uniref:Uncharacterized protein n=1 Tax=Actinomadura craniellae TaxID=2231787 RepID=A0A365GXE5_9ACTN|nr:hypothetical protein [Actinomadura craniellae]RAY11438.1 hypothetical protein DPM19_30955 [Actinomadura craniellae]